MIATLKIRLLNYPAAKKKKSHSRLNKTRSKYQLKLSEICINRPHHFSWMSYLRDTGNCIFIDKMRGSRLRCSHHALQKRTGYSFFFFLFQFFFFSSFWHVKNRRERWPFAAVLNALCLIFFSPFDFLVTYIWRDSDVRYLNIMSWKKATLSNDF